MTTVYFYVLKCPWTFSPASPTSKKKMVMNWSMQWYNNVECSQDKNWKMPSGFNHTEVTGYLWRSVEGGNQTEPLQKWVGKRDNDTANLSEKVSPFGT